MFWIGFITATVIWLIVIQLWTGIFTDLINWLKND